MKHFTITLSLLLCSFSIWAQNYSEDFESYEPFSRIAEQSENWRCWNHEYEKAKDAFVSDAEAHSGNNSLYLFSSRANGGPTDVVLDFGEAYASGEMEIEFWMFVKKESGGYFNFQGTHEDGKATALQCYMFGDSLFLDDMSTFYRTSFSLGEWHKINYQIDLTKGQWTMNIDDQEVASFTKTGINNSIAGIDFYPVNDDPSNNNSAYWVDDVTWSFTPYTFPTTNFAIVDADFRGGRLDGETTNVSFFVKNESNQIITDVKAKQVYNGQTQSELFSDLRLMPGGITELFFKEALTINVSEANCEIALEMVNSQNIDENPKDDSYSLNLSPLVPAIYKMVLIEEGTGTWCGWCPRGAVTLDKFHKDYSEYSVGVAVHYGDPMESQFYTDYMSENHFAGYPSGQVDRRVLIGMGFEETRANFYDKLEEPAYAGFDVAAKQSDNSLKVTIDFKFTNNVNNDWRVGCILIEDGVTGTDGYAQSNFYSGGSRGEMGGYESLPSVVPASQMVYNHVARSFAPSPTGSPLGSAFAAKDVEQLTFTFSIKDGWNTENMSLIPVLFKPDGSINNVGHVSLEDALANEFKTGKEVAGSSDIIGEELAIYPNPTNDVLNIQLGSNQQASIRLYSANGSLVKQQMATERTSLNVSDLPKGIYTLLVQSGLEIKSKKVVVE